MTCKNARQSPEEFALSRLGTGTQTRDSEAELKRALGRAEKKKRCLTEKKNAQYRSQMLSREETVLNREKKKKHSSAEHPTEQQCSITATRVVDYSIRGALYLWATVHMYLVALSSFRIFLALACAVVIYQFAFHSFHDWACVKISRFKFLLWLCVFTAQNDQ